LNFTCFRRNCMETFTDNYQFTKLYIFFDIIKLDQTKLLRTPLWIEQCHLCSEGHLKSHLTVCFLFQAFSRRWDMERHLNKSKYGCPANRFSSPGSQEPESPNEHSLLPSPSHHSMINNSSSQHSLLAILPHSHQQLNTN